jgi:hypothetical protein
MLLPLQTTAVSKHRQLLPASPKLDSLELVRPSDRGLQICYNGLTCCTCTGSTQYACCSTACTCVNGVPGCA